jgi:hypothetical protein
MHALRIFVAPNTALEAAVSPVFVDVGYSRTIESKPSDGVADLPNMVQETLRFALDDNLRGSVQLVDTAPSSPINLCFLGGDGTVRLTKSLTAGDSGELSFKLTKAEIAAITAKDPQPEPFPPQVQRRAYFVPTNDVRVPFEVSTLQIAPVKLAQDNWSKLGLDHLFLSDAPLTTSVQWPTDGWGQSGSLAWIPTHVAVDGQFGFAVAQGAGDAWMWWLTGPVPAIGIVIDDLREARVVRIGVPLPPFLAAASTGAAPERVPTDVTETEVASNPHIYTEDPGEFCRPFKNPERVLGERSFFVILRAEQPVISAEASIVVDPLPTLGYGVLAGSIAPSSGMAIARMADVPRVPPGGLIADTPDVIFARHALPTPYLDMLRRFNRGRSEMDARNPVQWESDISRYQATTVARGHILEFRMRWRSNGYSLGTVAKTLTLAPRQSRRIQKVEWRRVEAARRQETTGFREQVSDVVQREREYDDAVQSNLSEWSHGHSEATMKAGAVGAGFAAAGFVIGGGGVASKATSDATQEGNRSVSASEEQRLRDSIRRYGDSLRKLDSIVVTEVTQEEEATGTTEVVRNQNYGHSLTVIYYQILRHLKIETAVAGVRECLFVPFAIRPFTSARAYRWRDAIRSGLRDARYAPALDYLKDVTSGFVNSTVPVGKRSDQPVQYIYGSLFVKLAIDRPKDKDDGNFDPAAWTTVQPFLGSPALAIFNRLKALAEAQRDAIFQRDHAPTIAASWADTLQFEASGVKLASADFTLATRYQFGNVVRIDFTIANPNVTRETLTTVMIKATKALPPGSVANLQSVSFTYQTTQFQRTVAASQGSGDLIIVETGAIDTAGATASVPTDAWERQDIRAEMIEAVSALVEHLNDHVEYYHKLIWWNMDRDRLFMLIDGFYVPGTNGVSIASVVEREPIAIMGNAIVFRVSSGAFVGIGSIKTPADLFNYYVAKDAPSEPILVSLPTDGLYAQAVMDECSALEEHFGNTDWALNEPDLELGSIAPELLATRRAEPVSSQPSPFPQTIINLQNAPEAPAPAGLAGALSAVTTASAFRDMAGLAGTQANAATALQSAAALASSFGAQAAALKLAETAKDAHTTQTADQKLATVQRAVDKGLVSKEDAQQHASNILDGLKPQPASRPDPAAVLSQPIFQSASSIKAATPEYQIEALLDSGGGGGGGGGGAAATVWGGGVAPAAWAKDIDPFPPPEPSIPLLLSDPGMTSAFTPLIATHAQFCVALVDLTGDPVIPPYAGLNDHEMIFPGSLMKIAAMYAAFALRTRVQAFVDAAKAAGASLAINDIATEIERAWGPKLKALFPNHPQKSFKNNQDLFPKLDQIFVISAAGKVDFAQAGLTDAQIDALGEFGVGGRFCDWMRSMLRCSSNPAGSKAILALGYFYINGALDRAGFFDAGTKNGLWLSADFQGHDWVRTQEEKDDNAAGQPLTARWASAQFDLKTMQPRTKSNVTATAAQLARFMTLLARGQLLDPQSSQAMRTLLDADNGCTVHFAKDALTAAGRTPTACFSKIGVGDDVFIHDCAIIERTVNGKNLRYVAVGLGAAPKHNPLRANTEDLADLFVNLDAVIVARNS